jgi:CheY-like chemotaxis protein
VAIVVVGTFRLPEEAARFVALGVARTVTKPVAPALLRAMCDELVDVRDERTGDTVRVTLGEPTLEHLAERLADELKRALIDGVDLPARSYRVPLGEGTEVLGALWGAIARIQELIAQKTGGAIRYGGETPEGAIALAPWLQQDLSGADRLAGRGRGAAADVRLHGRRVVVADDDPGVTWFISDLLRTAGCEVHEALDGATALSLAFRVQPELVVSDILMPGLDGFALCRALRRDVALRDTPVILLSWKEDLLQRVRELGASAAAYMRKESGSRAILARVREVLRPRARIESRLRGEGEVRGRLDGLTPRLLLDLVCMIRKDARISLRDATYLYEVEVRAGAPRKVTRTASDGNYQSGERALASLLGVGAGRFVVTPSREPMRGDLTGSLFEQLIRPIARARGALAAVAGARTASVERIAFDEETIDLYLRATPEPTRTLIKRLAQGVSPRQMLLSGEVAPSLLEDVLSDLAVRGAISGVEGAKRVDLLTPEIEAALEVLQGSATTPSMPPNARPSAPFPATLAALRATRGGELEPPAVVSYSVTEPTFATLAMPTRAEPPDESSEDGDEIPSSLEDAVMREISDRTTEPRTSRSAPAGLPPIIEPGELRRRSSNPPDGDAPGEGEGEAWSEPGVMPSIPPDAVVPGATTSEDLLAATTGRDRDESTHRADPSTPAAALSGPVHTSNAPRQSRPPARAEGAAPAARMGVLPVLGVLGLALAAVFYWAYEGERKPAIRGEPEALVTPSTSGADAAPTVLALAPAATHAAAPAVEDDLPPGAEVPAGFGLLEVRAPARAIVRIDGTFAGSGPFVASVSAPGYHEVRVEQGGHESRRVVEVRVGKTARIELP